MSEKRVTGRFDTKYGPCRFNMHSAKDANLFIDGVWTVFGVEWSGQMRVAKLADDQNALTLQAVNGWYIRGGETSIGRVDKKPVNFKSDTYDKVKEAMIRGFTNYIHHPSTSGVLTIAAKVKIENEMSELDRKVENARKALEAAESARDHFKNINHDLYNALKMGVDRMTPDKYDADNVKVES